MVSAGYCMLCITLLIAIQLGVSNPREDEMKLLYVASFQYGGANTGACLAISLNVVLIPPPCVFKLLLNCRILKPQDFEATGILLEELFS